jgi:predicted ATPase/DNA-binding NarL/FixJ family response regulator
MATQQRRLPRPHTSFVGRRRDLDALGRLLGDASVRLVTLIGPGGVGKTRLALQVSEDAHGTFVHGWEFVDLAPVERAELAPEAVARALGLELDQERLTEQVIDYLSSRNLLLVLDNFEQVLEAESFVAELLDACPDLVVLITSRRVLNLRAATNYFVEPLPLPAVSRAVSVEDAAGFDAVRLFADRAYAADARFRLTEANAPHVVEICRRLEGVPLAIELAAARTRLLAVEAIAQRLDQSLQLLAGGPRDAPERQQSLRSLIAWSYDLLTPDERVLLQRISLFVGGFSIERLEQLEAQIVVLGGEPPAPGHAIDRLQALIDASLLHRVETRDGERFRMLETIRAFAAIELGVTDTADLAREAHARVMLAVAEAGKAGLLGPDPARWSDLLEQEIENIRAALRWAVAAPDPGPELALKLCNAIWLFWKRSLRLAEGRDWLERSLRAAGNAESIDVGNVQILLGHSIFDDPAASAAAYERGLAIYRQFGDRRRIAGATISLASTIASMGNDEEALRLYREGAEIFEELELLPDLAVVEAQLGRLYVRTGDYERAQEHFDRATILYSRLDDITGAAETRHSLARLMFDRGRLDEAKSLLLLCRTEFERLRIHDLLGYTLCDLGVVEFDLGNRTDGIALYKEGLQRIREFSLYTPNTIEALYQGAYLLLRTRQNAEAEQLLAAAKTLGEHFDFVRTESQQRLFRARDTIAAASPHPDSFAAERIAGQSMSLESAMGFAESRQFHMREEEKAPSRAPAIDSILTAREAEVICLLGLTDREIAERLFIGVRTVTTHVSHILSKLEVSTRSSAIALGVRYGWCRVAE